MSANLVVYIINLDWKFYVLRRCFIIIENDNELKSAQIFTLLRLIQEKKTSDSFLHSYGSCAERVYEDITSSF